jgi:succinyl-CoA synthetase beta subunit
VKIHEYQGKEIFRSYGMPTPRGIPAFSVDEAVKAAESLGGKVWVVKAQIHAGGRGKGGGVKVAKSIDEVRQRAGEILGMQLVTHQTGPAGQKVRRLLIEEGADIARELYVGMVVDRGTQRVALMASSEGGMDIEEVAAKTPEKIERVFIDPGKGLTDAEADSVSRRIGVPEPSVPQARAVLQSLYRAFDETDASLAEINPLVLTGDGKLIVLDAKLNFDANALFRHPEIGATWMKRIRRKSRRRNSIFPTSRSTAISVASSMAPGWQWRRWTPSSSMAARRRIFLTSGAAPLQKRSPRHSRSC